MYKLMVVDDEPFIADGLAALFSNIEDPFFEVFVAYSAQEALLQLDKTRMDIVISDIKMPKMSGIEMLAQIKERWPFCHVIFLSGYSDFEYVQSALDYGADAYLLKNQSDDAIVDAVLKTINRIEKENETTQLQQRIHEEYEYALPVLQKDFIQRLLHAAYIPEEDIVKNKMKSLHIPLLYGQPVILIGCRIDQVSIVPMTPAEQAAKIDAIFMEYMLPKATTFCVFDSSKYLFWLVQKKSQISSNDILYRYIPGTLEKIQLCCCQMNLPISLVWDPSLYQWDQLAMGYDRIRSTITFLLDPKTEMVLCDTNFFQSSANHPHTPNSKVISDQIQQMRTALEYRQKESFLMSLDQILEQVKDPSDPVSQIAAYHSLCTLFLDWIQITGQKCAYLQRFGSFSIFSLPYNQWTGTMAETFRDIALFLFDGHQANQTPHFHQIIQTLHQYISENLTSDLTIPALAAQVYLNPVYLSRAYRQTTGKKLSEYVQEARIKEAKKLLKGREYKINEIAFAVGFDSAAHFSRVFKKQTSLTPQEYRERSI